MSWDEMDRLKTIERPRTMLDGWIADYQTWTYASASTFTVSGDVRLRFQVGTKIKLTQTTQKYFYSLGATYSAPNTTVTVTGGSDYSLANAAITSPAYSYSATPQGFPKYFNFVPAFNLGNAVIASGFAGGQARFRVIEGACIYDFTIQNGSLSGTAGAIGISLPVAASASTWSASYLVYPIAGEYINARAQWSGTTLTMYKSMTAATWTATETGLYIYVHIEYTI